MDFELIYFGPKQEAELLENFFEWQGINLKAQIKPETLRHTGGHPAVVLLKDGGKIKAIGFFAIVNWWKENGLCRC